MPGSDAAYLPENILDALPRGVIVADEDWRIRYANQSLLQAVHCSAEALLGEHLCSVGNKIGVTDSLHELLDYLVHLTKTPPTRLETRAVQVRIPERKFIRVTVQPYRVDQESRPGYLVTFSDYTREGGINEMKNDFISEASHELRTPMTSIKGSLELLLGGYAGELSEETTELLGICLAAVDRLIRLVNDVLDISKIESGRMELNRERLNVAECIHKSMRILRSLAEANKVSVELEAPNEIPDVVADRDRLEQVITNLLSNALKYSPSQSSVRIRVQSSDGAVSVSVTDQGPGIPPDQLQKVFDRFRQLEGAKKGTGLGLTISRALVEQHGGRIWAESAPGRGASFHFELPGIPPE